jgi:hypothetical protein
VVVAAVGRPVEEEVQQAADRIVQQRHDSSTHIRQAQVVVDMAEPRDDAVRTLAAAIHSSADKAVGMVADIEMKNNRIDSASLQSWWGETSNPSRFCS